MAPLREALLRPRHICVSLAILVAVGSVGVAVAGNTQTEGEPAPAASIAPLPIPLPAQGDRGVFSYTLEEPDGPFSGRYGSISFGLNLIQFEWAEDALRLNATGDRHWTNTLNTATRGQEGNWRNDTVALYAGAKRSLAIDSYEERSESVPSQGVVQGGDATELFTYRFTQFTDWPMLHLDCGLRNAFQGSTIPGGALSIDADSLSCFGLGLPKGSIMKAVAQRLTDQGREVRFEVGQDDARALPDGWVWFREGIPYPIRAEFPDGKLGKLHVWKLERFEAGTMPLHGAEAGVPAVSAVATAQRLPWTMDDTGVAHPFPLSAAFARARDTPDQTRLRDFLAAHPDAYVAEARTAAFFTAEGKSWRWQFVVTDGADHAGFEVLRRDAPAEGLPVSLEPTTTYSFGEIEPGLYFGDSTLFLSPDELPPEIPTAASLIERWKAYATPEVVKPDGLSYGFLLQRDPDGQGGTPGFYFTAGRTLYEWQAGPLYPLVDDSTGGWQSSEIGSYEQWDRVDRLDEMAEDRVPPSMIAPTTSVEQGEVEADEIEPLAAGTFLERISLPEAAGLGFLSFLAAGLYYLWPAGKAGLIGLFSRVQGPDLLANPVRNRIYQAIEANPGIHAQALVRLAGAGQGGTEHHLSKLVSSGLVTRHAGKGFTCYFVRGSTDRRTIAAAPLLKSPVAKALYRAALEQPGRTPTELARELGVSPPTISYHLRRLEAAGLVQSTDGIRLDLPRPPRLLREGPRRNGYRAAAGSPSSVAA